LLGPGQVKVPAQKETNVMNVKKTLLCIFLVFCLFLIIPEQGITAQSYDITIIAGPGGKIVPGGSSINAGTDKSFSIKPNKGFHIAEIRVDGATIFEDRKESSTPNDGTSPPIPTDANLQRSGTTKVYKYIFQSVQQGHSLEAVFETDTFALHIIKTGLGTGLVESSPAGISCGDSCVGVFPYSSNVTFTATGGEGSVFDGWTGKCKGSGNSCSMNIKKASSLIASFARAFNLSISISGEGKVSSSPKGVVCEESCSAQVKENSIVKLKARVSAGSLFFGWTGCTASSGSTCTVSMNEAQFVAVSFVGKDVPSYTLDKNNLPESIILPVPSAIPRQNGASGHCYIESFAVQMAYIDPAVTMEEVFTLAGLGGGLSYSSWGKAFLSSPPDNWTWTLQTRVMRNYGVQFIIGYTPGMSREYQKGAIAQITHENEDDALRNLKAVIRTGRPVQVHIDLYYLPPELVSVPISQPGASHFIIITGYDADGVYMTNAEPDYVDFPVDPSEYVNVKIPMANFLMAWQEAGKINKGDFTFCAPYWMLFLEEKNMSETIKTPVDDILSLQRSISQNNASVIERNLSKDFSKTPWSKIMMAKGLFADYLRNYGYTEAANKYDFLAGEYRACEWLSVDEQKTKLNDVIKPLEIEVRTLF